MSLRNPLEGHFEYTEYFHLPWLWRDRMTRVLMIGLGGGSTPRSYQHYYTNVVVDAVELDPLVVKVAREYFKVKESPALRIHQSDGRVFLRRATNQYDAIIMDAYTGSRYGSFIPYHMATKEFFQMASDSLPENGVLAYNVIGTWYGWQADILGAIYNTMKAVFPQVYLCPARESQNVVVLGVKSNEAIPVAALQQKADRLVAQGRVTLPAFKARAQMLRTNSPPSTLRSPILTDDFAPVDGLLRSVRR